MQLFIIVTSQGSRYNKIDHYYTVDNEKSCLRHILETMKSDDEKVESIHKVDTVIGTIKKYKPALHPDTLKLYLEEQKLQRSEDCDF